MKIYNFEKLIKINPEVIGWVKIPNTNINYPIVQTDNNDKYLHTNFNGNKDKSGTVFLDCECNNNFNSRNNIIYGHCTRPSILFKKRPGKFNDIGKYVDSKYCSDHKTIYLYTPNKTMKLEVIGAFNGSGKDVIARKSKFASDTEFTNFVKNRIKNCSYAQLPYETIDKIYTFITCSYEIKNGRTFLYAVESN